MTLAAPPAPAAQSTLRGSWREMLRAAPVTFGGEISLMGLAFLVEWLLASRLGPAGFGCFKAAFISAPVLLVQAIYLNLESAILHHSVRRPEAASELAATSLAYALVAGGTGFVLGVLTLGLWAPLLGGEVPRILLVLGLAQVPFLLAQIYLRAALQARGRYAAFSAVLPCERLLVLGGILVSAALAGWHMVPVATGWLVGVAGASALAIGLLARGGGLAGKPSWKAFRSLAGFGAGFAFALIAYLAMFSINQMWVLGSCGAAQAGLYAMAAMMGQILLYLPKAVVPAYCRTLSGLPIREARRLTAQAVRLTFLALAVISVTMAWLAPWILHRILPAYEGALPILLWIFPGVLAMGALLYLFYHHRVEGNLGWLNVSVFLGLAVDLLLCHLWIRSDGPVGAARAFSVASLTMLAVLGLASYLGRSSREPEGQP